MYSFYGGRPGNSFIIVTTFRSVNDMVNAFKEGPNYTVVHYDEYVMINTVDKNDPDNGKIFRRGYNFNEIKVDEEGQPILDENENPIPTGGAEYIGTIAGPSGNAPDLYLTTISDVQSKNAVSDSRRFGNYNLNDGNLIPGKQGIGITDQTIWHDEIKWESCFIKDQNSENTKAYIGFQIPYTVFDIDAETVSSQTQASVRQQIFEENHPFYKHLTFSIPEGQKGDSINNLRIFEINDINKYQIEEQNYNHRDQDASAKRKILVYDSYSYEENSQGDKKTYYLGDYNMIKNIYLDEQGKIHVNYTHDYNASDDNENQIINDSNPIKWIDNISLDKNNRVNINYNTGEPDKLPFIWIDRAEFNAETQQIEFFSSQSGSTPVSTCPIKMINAISSNDNGNIVISYNDNTSDTIQNTIKQVTRVELENGILNVYYSDNPTVPVPLNTNAIKWITGTSFNNNTNEITFNYNIENSDTYKIRNINNIDLSNTGILTVNYNDNSSQQLNQNLKWIKNVQLNNNRISITWNDNTNQEIGQPINYIIDTKLDANNNVLVKYSAPPEGATIDSNGYIKIGTITTRAEYNINDVQSDINWSGIGEISIGGGSNIRIVNFTLPVIGSFSPNVKRVVFNNSLNGGNLVVSDGTQNASIQMTQDNTSITKTFTGIRFQVQIQNSVLATSGFVNLAFSGMNLKFLDITT